MPGLGGLPDGALVVPNAGDLTWAEVSLDDATVAGLAAGLPEVPDAQARAVLWVALLGSVHRGEVDPRVVLDVFGTAWARETSSSVLTRVALVTTNEVVPHFLPPAEQEPALAAVAQAADGLLASLGVGARPRRGRAARSSRPGCGRAPARTPSGCGAGRPATASRGRSRATTTSGGSSCGGSPPSASSRDADIDEAEAADRSLAGALAALGVRAVRPTVEAKEWAWAQLRDNEHLSNHGALSVAGGFWAAPDLDLVRPWVDRVGDLVVGMSRRMADDALSRVVTAIHPTRVVEEATATASAAVLARDDLTAGARRAFVDADHELHEALASRRRFG